jgi:tetratricopeptide (TPR) repeat protein
MRISTVVVVLLLAGCADQGISRLGNGPPGLNIARAALSGGSPDIALNVSNGIVAKEPRNVPALLSQGDALSALDRLEEAEQSYAKALGADPESVGAQIGLGRLRLRSDPAQARLLFTSVLQREPRNKVALNDLGIACDLQGEHAAAQSAYRRALGVDPTLRAAEVNLALSMALSGQASEAVQMLKPLASNSTAPRRVRHDLAVALAVAGDKQEAARVIGGDMTPEQVDRALLAYGAFGP